MDLNDAAEPRQLADGIVSAVTTQKKDPARVSVFIDGAFAFGLSAEIAVREGLRTGRAVTAEEQRLLLAQEGASAARAMALEYLSRRARTCWEVRKKLSDAGFADDTVDAVLVRLTELGYVDDRAYARRFALARLERRYGPRRIVQELRRRGIPDPMAEEVLADVRDESEVRARADEAARQRAGRLRNEPDARKRKKKMYDFLIRRGFESDIAWSVVNTIEDDEAS